MIRNIIINFSIVIVLLVAVNAVLVWHYGGTFIMLRPAVEKLRKEIEVLEAKKIILVKEKVELQTDVAILRKDKVQLEKDKNQLEKYKTELESRIKTKEGELSGKTDDVSNLQKQVKELQKAKEDNAATIASLNSEITGLGEIVGDPNLIEAVGELQRALKTAKKNEKDYEERLAKCKAAYESYHEWVKGWVRKKDTAEGSYQKIGTADSF